MPLVINHRPKHSCKFSTSQRLLDAIRCKDRSMFDSVAAFATKLITCPFRSKNSMLSYRLMSGNVATLLNTPSNALHTLKDEDVAYSEFLYRTLAMDLEDVMPEKIRGEFRTAVLEDDIGAFDAKMRDYEAEYTNVLQMFAENTRDIQLEYVSEYFDHLRHCCEVRASVIRAFISKIGDGFAVPHVAACRFPESHAISDITKQLGQKLRFATEFASPPPYDLLAAMRLVHCLAKEAGLEVPFDPESMMDDFANGILDQAVSHKCALLFEKACSVTASIGVFTDCGPVGDVGGTVDIDDALALWFLGWLSRFGLKQVTIVMCDRPKSCESGARCAWEKNATASAEIKRDCPGGANIEVTHALIIGPVHERTMHEIFASANTIVAVSPDSGVNAVLDDGTPWKLRVAKQDVKLSEPA